MEIILISDTQLKIMMSAEDMRKYNIDGTGEDSRDAIRSILAEAKESCGYDTDGFGVYVQYFPSKQGGGEIFFTKVSRESGGGALFFPPDLDGYITDDDCDDDFEIEIMRNDCHTTARYKSGYIIYEFEKLDDLLRCCAAVLRSGRPGDSLAYSMDAADSGVPLSASAREYFLLLERDCPAASEYAASRADSAYFYVLEEHGRLLCRNAAEKLGPLA